MKVKSLLLLLFAILVIPLLHQLLSKITQRTPPSHLPVMGFEKEILKEGNWRKPRPGESVTVHCTGYGKDGDLSKKFWSTKDPGQKPFTFVIGQKNVIAGWDEGVLGMNLGEIARLKCSPDYAYGAGGFPAWGIRPNSVLIFEIEVLSIA